MSTGVESFGSLHELGALYPFPGSEGLLVLIAFVVWIGWHVVQLRNESREFEIEHEELKDKAHNASVFDWEISKFK